MIKILNSANETQAILENVVSPLVSEEINGQFTFSFSTVIDSDKSSYVNYQNKVEADSNYFNIAYTEEERTQDGLFITAQCEHVSYDLLSANFTAGFTAAGQFSAIATTLLAGTGFTVGTVEITASGTVSINESTNARAVLLHLANVIFEGELEFDKYQINLLTRRGADRGVQFRYRKNLIGVKRITDNRKKVAGLPTISYQVSTAELEFEQGFIDANVADLEHYELGDTVKVIDEDLDLEASLRIVKESHDPEQRGMGIVEISNAIEDIGDTIKDIQEDSVSKGNVYNGCSIGPELGFVATRSDNLARAIMNATDGIKIQKGDGTGNWTDAIYLDTSGNGTFTGFVLAAQMIGGSIVIGTGSNTFNANGTNGIWLGSSAFATAPFSVTLSGATTAANLLLTGGEITIGTSGNTMRFNDTDGLWLGSTAFVTARFSVSMGGVVTARTSAGETIIDGSSNMFKVAVEGTTTIEIASGDGDETFTVAHNLGYRPAYLAFRDDVSYSRSGNLPYMIWAGGSGVQIYISEMIRASVDSADLTIQWYRSPDRAAIGSASATIHYYLLQEAAF